MNKLKYVILSFLLLLINVVSFQTQYNTEYKLSSGTLQSYEKEEQVYPLNTSGTFVQYFIPQKNYIESLEIKLPIAASQKEKEQEEINFKICTEADLVVYETTIKDDEEGHFVFYINKKVDENLVYYFIITGLDNIKESVNFQNMIQPVSAKENLTCLYKGTVQCGNLPVVYNYSYKNLEPFGLILITDIVIIALVWCFCEIYKKLSQKVKKIIDISMWVVIVPIMLYLVQILSVETMGLKKEYIIANLLFYYLILLIITFFCRKLKNASLLFTFALVIVSLLDYYVTYFRGQAFMLSDFFSYKTAATVVGSYSLEIPIRMGRYLLVCWGIVAVHMLLEQGYIWGKEKKLRFRVLKQVIVVSCIMLLSVYLNKNVSFALVNLWDTRTDYVEKGLIYTLMAEGQYLKVDKPEGYSVAKVEKIKEELNITDVSQSENKEQTIPNNLILIMNESLADLSVIGELPTDNEILPYITNLQGVSKGYLYMPVFGAGTAESEYEVLTGNSKQFLAVGSVAYELYTHTPEYGLAYCLKEQGYTDIALHPYLATNWNRKTVYDRMQFDQFISQENWEDPVNYLRWCIDDETAYRKIIKKYEEKENDEKLFAFCVTMQNHGGYSEESSLGFQNTVSLNTETEYPYTETYLSAINVSDQAFKELIEYFDSVEETTMIVMFGDHQPAIEDEFYKELFGVADLSELNTEDAEKQYMTPYVIWTNYSTSTSEENMSSNYFGSYILQKAGLKMTSYEKSILKIKETLPVITRGVVCDKNGNWYQINDSLPEEYKKLIEDYKTLQYNNVFDHSDNVVHDISD